MKLLNTAYQTACVAPHTMLHRETSFPKAKQQSKVLLMVNNIYCMKQYTHGVITANSSTGQNQKAEVSSRSNEDAVQKHGTCSIRTWARHHRRSMKFHVMTTAMASIPCASMRSASQISHIVGTGRKGLSNQAQSGGEQ